MMKKIIVLLLVLSLFACTKKTTNEPQALATPSSTTETAATTQPTAEPTTNTVVQFADEAINQIRDYMDGASLAIIYAGTLYGGEEELNAKYETIVTKYPFILNMADSQFIYGDIEDGTSVEMYILIPHENVSVAINSLITGNVIYRDEYGTPAVFMCSTGIGNPSAVITVVDNNGSVAEIALALSLYDGHIRDNMNQQILDLSDYEYLYYNYDVPFYQQGCFDNVMYREDVMTEINAGKQIRPLWEVELNGQWYLVFGLGTDPTTSDGIEAFYASRPDTSDVYYSTNMTEWILLDASNGVG